MVRAYARAMSRPSSFLRFALLLFASPLALASMGACGSGTSSGVTNDTSGNTPSTCESAGARICQRACACSTDGKCRLAVMSDAGATASLTFDDEKHCRNLYVDFGCTGGGEPSLDYARCESSIAASSCVEPKADRSGQKGLLFTDECTSKP